MSERSHVFRRQTGAAHLKERLFGWLLRGVTYLVLLCGVGVFATIVVKGAPTVFRSTPPFINVAFLTQAPESLYVFEFEGKKYEQGDREHRAFVTQHPAAAKVRTESYVYSAGGIFPNIVGTILLVLGSMAIALTLGVAAAIYLSEYAKDGRFIRFVRLAILNLAGVPSIVFGLFGFGMFVVFFGWNVSLLAGWFTLAFMVLPVVITASEESLRAVPRGFREGSLALGATKWQTIRGNVLPYALPGILTSSILGIARVAGETAPIMFTAAYVVRDKLPWDVAKVTDFFFQGVMALPYHIYVVSSKIPQNEYTARVQYGTAFVFLVLVAVIAAASILFRNRLRKRYQW
ncbi:phosphate ABC transporter permease PstA [Opitutus sp. ER46]|uniref:phosphate ABC transporter permease PstA n=1 Tax=Opitutus sp. ER46 TaxID=2161864 RepID=UPI000D31B425|nr:phosphate ABC transporter permease PstA [Opitutus sp. ER46]PTY01099.1 phosphate ABC transporter permease PtsA [Opitutus sp. ER46]